MSINITLIGQIITFLIFVLFTMRFVWPEMEKVLDDRKLKISNGLNAAKEGHLILEQAKKEALKKVEDTKIFCDSLVLKSKNRAQSILDDAKEEALREKNSILASGSLELAKNISQAKLELHSNFVDLVILGSEKVLCREIKPEDHHSILGKLNKELV